MGDDKKKLTPEEIKNNEEYAAGQKAGQEGDIFSDSVQRLTDDDSIWDKGYREGESNRDSLCFLTTACTVSRGLPDNCIELVTLRQFRDRVLLQSPTGRRAVQEYYAIAPEIVSRINSTPDVQYVWNQVYGNVQRAVHLVQTGQFNAAFDHYKSMVTDLKGKFLR